MKKFYFIAALTLTVALSTHTTTVVANDHDNHEAGHAEENHNEHNESVTLTQEEALAVGIQIQKSAPQTIKTTTLLTGRVVLNEDQTSDQLARFAGQVQSVHVHLGDSVKKGQTLAVLISVDGLGKYNVTAPFTGVITYRKPTLGDIKEGDKLFTVSDMSSVWAKFHVFPRDAKHVRKGQDIQVHMLDDDAQAKAKISILSPTADIYSQTHIAIAELPNKGKEWRSGMTVQGDVFTGEKQAKVAVLKTAIQSYEGKSVVFIQEDGVHYEPKPVELGVSDDMYVEVLSGLEEGELYVSKGSFVIKSDLLKSSASHAH